MTDKPMNLNDVEMLEERSASWLARCDPGVADRYMQDAFDGLVVLPEQARAKAEAKLRSRYDNALKVDGEALDADLQATLQRIDAEIARDENLAGEEANYQVGTFDRIMIENAAAAAEDRVLSRLAGKTLQQVLDAYQRAGPGGTLVRRALMRVVEHGLGEAHLAEDHEHDARAVVESWTDCSRRSSRRWSRRGWQWRHRRPPGGPR
jgi:GNAT superfamily N-acetyltransferase